MTQPNDIDAEIMEAMLEPIWKRVRLALTATPPTFDPFSIGPIGPSITGAEEQAIADWEDFPFSPADTAALAEEIKQIALTNSSRAQSWRRIANFGNRLITTAIPAVRAALGIPALMA